MSQREHHEKDDFSLKNFFIPLTTLKAIHWIIFVGFFVYFNSLFNGFVFDDLDQLVRNPLVHSLNNLPLIFTGKSFAEVMVSPFYRPVFFTAYSLIFAIFGASSFFFHLSQVLLHCINAILVFLLFSAFFKKNLSFILALIFLLHPINNQTVVYVANLQDVLFFLFGTLAFLIVRSHKLSKALTFFLSAIFLILAIFSKETAVLFLIIIPVYLYFFKKNKALLYTLQSISVLGIYTFFRFFVANIDIVRESVVPIAREPLIIRLITLPKIITYYFQTFIFPKDLVSLQIWIVEKMSFKDFYLPLLTVLILLVSAFLIGAFIKKHNKGYLKLYGFFIVWLFIGLLLHFQIIPLDMTVADRWFYFPIVGLLGIVGIVAELLKINNKYIKRVILVFICLLLLAYAIRDIIRNTNWYNDLTIYSHDAQLQKNYMLENGYGNALLRANRYEEARLHLENSVALAPYAFLNWNNLGYTYYQYAVRKKDSSYLSKTENAYKTAIKNKKNNYTAAENLALFYYFNADAKKTEQFIKENIKMFPNNRKLWFVKALVENKLGNREAAIESAKKAFNLSKDLQVQQLLNSFQTGKKYEFEEADLFP